MSWEAPATDGGSAITEYRVQWKETAGNWDAPADVSEETVTGTTYTITGLTDGVEYAVRVIAVNDVGDGPPSDEATGTPGETTPPELSTATVDGATLTLTYDEDLDENSEPSPDAFSVTAGGTGRAVDGVSVSGSSVILTLGPAVVAGGNGNGELRRADGCRRSPNPGRGGQSCRVLQRPGRGEQHSPAGQHSGHGSAQHQRDGPGGRDADCGHVGH